MSERVWATSNIPSLTDQMEVLWHSAWASPPGHARGIASAIHSGATYKHYARKHLTLPNKTIWSARIEVSACARVWVNGTEVSRVAQENIYVGWAGYDIISLLVPNSENVIAIYAIRTDNQQPYLAVMGEIVYSDGTLEDICSKIASTGWGKFPLADPASDWYELAFDDSGWQAEGSGGDQQLYDVYFPERPPCFGGKILLRNPDEATVGHERLIFDSGSVAVNATFPIGLHVGTPNVHWSLWSQAARTDPVPVWADQITSDHTTDATTMTFALAMGALTEGVYTLSVGLYDGATPVGSASITKEPILVLATPSLVEIEGATFEEGFPTLEPELTIDFTAPGTYDWIESNGTVEYPTARIRNTLTGLSYRETNGTTVSSFIGTKFALAHPGDFYEGILYVPDDAIRNMGIEITHRSPDSTHCTLTGNVNQCFRLGQRFPNSGEMKVFKFLFVAQDVSLYGASEKMYLNLVNLRPGYRAAAQKIEFIHVGQALPVPYSENDATAGRFTGPNQERALTILRTFGELNMVAQGSDTFGWDYSTVGGVAKKWSLTLQDRYAQRLAWQLGVCKKYLNYLRFMGMNYVGLGCFQYSIANGSIDPNFPGSRVPLDYRHILLALAGKYGIAVAANVQYRGGAGTDGMGGNSFFKNASTSRLMEHTVQEICQQFAPYSAFRGVSFQMWPRNAYGSDTFHAPCFLSTAADCLSAGYDATTTGEFETDTGISIPPEWDDTEANRKTWLLANALEAWRNWRCTEVRAFLLSLKTIAQTFARPVGASNLKVHANLFLECHSNDDHLTPAYAYSSVRDYLRGFGYDPALYAGDTDLYVAPYSFISQEYGFEANDPTLPYNGWRWNEDLGVAGLFSGGDNRKAFLHEGFQETILQAVGSWDWTSDFAVLHGGMFLDYESEVFAQAVANLEADLLEWGWMDTTHALGHEQMLRTFTKHFTRLPKTKMPRIYPPGTNQALHIHALVEGGKYFFYLLNTTPATITATIYVTGGAVYQLFNNSVVPLSDTSDPAKKYFQVSIGPFGLCSYYNSDATKVICNAIASGQGDLAVLADRRMSALVKDDVYGGQTAAVARPYRAKSRRAQAQLGMGEPGLAWDRLGKYDQAKYEFQELASNTLRPWAGISGFAWDGTAEGFDTVHAVESALLSGNIEEIYGDTYVGLDQEGAAGTAYWFTAYPGFGSHYDGFLDFEESVNPLRGLVGYAATYVYIPSAGTVTVTAGSGGPLKLWILSVSNVTPVIDTFKSPTLPSPDENSYSWSATGGWHMVVAKFGSHPSLGSQWGLFFDVHSAAGMPTLCWSRYLWGVTNATVRGINDGDPELKKLFFKQHEVGNMAVGEEHEHWGNTSWTGQSTIYFYPWSAPVRQSVNVWKGTYGNVGGASGIQVELTYDFSQADKLVWTVKITNLSASPKANFGLQTGLYGRISPDVFGSGNITAHFIKHDNSELDAVVFNTTNNFPASCGKGTAYKGIRIPTSFGNIKITHGTPTDANSIGTQNWNLIRSELGNTWWQQRFSAGVVSPATLAGNDIIEYAITLEFIET